MQCNVKLTPNIFIWNKNAYFITISWIEFFRWKLHLWIKIPPPDGIHRNVVFTSYFEDCCFYWLFFKLYFIANCLQRLNLLSWYALKVKMRISVLFLNLLCVCGKENREVKWLYWFNKAFKTLQITNGRWRKYLDRRALENKQRSC